MAARLTMKNGGRSPAAGLAMLLGVAMLLITGASASAAVPLKKLLVLDFELIDNQEGLAPFPEKEARLEMVSERLRAALAREKLYDVIDSESVAQRIRSEAERQSLLECNGCELDIAREAGAERVLVAWVQKVSNLILNINIQIRDVTGGRAVLTKSVDLRGNTDVSWQRAVDYLVRDMVEKGERNL